MKQIITIFFTCFLLYSGKSKAQSSELVYIRIQEVVFYQAAGKPYSYMRIVYPDKDSKLVELETVGKNGDASLQNGQKIQRELAILLNEGYEIKSCSVGGDMMINTTIILLTRKSS